MTKDQLRAIRERCERGLADHASNVELDVFIEAAWNDIPALLDYVEELRGALAWYADRVRYEWTEAGEPHSAIDDDEGRIARAALGEDG